MIFTGGVVHRCFGRYFASAFLSNPPPQHSHRLPLFIVFASFATFLLSFRYMLSVYRHCIYPIASIINIRSLTTSSSPSAFIFCHAFYRSVFYWSHFFFYLNATVWPIFSDSPDNGQILRWMVCVKSVREQRKAVNSSVIAPEGPSSQEPRPWAQNPCFNCKYSTCLVPIIGKLALSRREKTRE